MKALIWLGVLFVVSAITVGLKMFAGIQLGGIPTAIIYAIAFAVIRKLCKVWDEHKAEKE